MKHAIVDYRISDEEINNLSQLGCEVLICPPLKTLYPAVSGHPDMLMHIVDKNTIIVHKDMDESFISILRSLGKEIIFSKSTVGNSYPQDIILNAVNLKDIFMHNVKYTDSTLFNLISNKKIINVNQGYTKCSTAILSDRALMTSDKGIANAALESKLDVLVLPPGDILLPGLNYGFIGGCCGLFDEKLLCFYGDIREYKYGTEILNFLKRHNIEPFALKSGKLIDRGTLFII